MSSARPLLLGPEETTVLVTASSSGDRDARASLVGELYTELRRVASGHIQRDRTGHTLSATSLVHEAYLRLAAPTQLNVSDARHFLALASIAMRRLLVDYARRYRLRQEYCRTTDAITLDGLASAESLPQHLVELDEALRALEERDPRLGRLVEMRFFTGLSMDEIAAELGFSSRSAERAWVKARSFLSAYLSGDIAPNPPHVSQRVS